MSWLRAVSIGCLLGALLAAAGCREQQVNVGAGAPALAAFDLQGRAVSLDRWRGRPVYLTFWSVDCGGCAADMALLQRLSGRYGDRLVVLAVNTDPVDRDITPFIAALHLRFPVVRDQLGITQERYRVIGTPTAYLLNTQGTVVEVHQGAQGEAALTAMFQAALPRSS